MRKNLLFIMFVFTAFTHGMKHEDTSNFWTAMLDGTEINLTKDFLCDAYNKMEVDIMIVGRNQQKILSSEEPFDIFRQEVGEPYYSGRRLDIYSNKNSSDGVFDKEKVVCKKPSSYIFTIIEPYILMLDEQLLYYVCVPKKLLHNFKSYNADKRVAGTYEYIPGKHEYLVFEICGDKAIKEASKDLYKCYKIALTKAMKHQFHDKDRERQWYTERKRSIALPVLGNLSQEEGVSIAVASIVKHVKKYKKNNYNRIELVVETDYEFDLYKLLLMQDCGLTERICLLYCAYNDPEHFLSSLLPREIIHCIAKFM